ncbi:MAG: hypothetical protein ACREFR_13665 [Limisphaerales bacterium]
MGSEPKAGGKSVRIDSPKCIGSVTIGPSEVNAMKAVKGWTMFVRGRALAATVQTICERDHPW